MANRKRKKEFKLRLTEGELALLNFYWKQSGKRCRSDYLRELILYGKVYEANYSYLIPYREEIAKIGEKLNIIAHSCNEKGYATNADLALTKAYMYKVWRVHQAMLKRQPLQ